MARFHFLFASVFVCTLSLLAVACGGSSTVCTPGASVACVGTGGCAGGQVCNAAGTALGPCMCGGDTDGGGGTDLGGTDLGGTDLGMADMGAPDTGTPDLGAPDGGITDVCGSGLMAAEMECNACLSDHCCAEVTACVAEPACLPCLDATTSDPTCPTEPLSMAFRECNNANCTPACPML